MSNSTGKSFKDIIDKYKASKNQSQEATTPHARQEDYSQNEKYLQASSHGRGGGRGRGGDRGRGGGGDRGRSSGDRGRGSHAPRANYMPPPPPDNQPQSYHAPLIDHPPFPMQPRHDPGYAPYYEDPNYPPYGYASNPDMYYHQQPYHNYGPPPSQGSHHHPSYTPYSQHFPPHHYDSYRRGRPAQPPPPPPPFRPYHQREQTFEEYDEANNSNDDNDDDASSTISNTSNKGRGRRQKIKRGRGTKSNVESTDPSYPKNVTEVVRKEMEKLLHDHMIPPVIDRHQEGRRKPKRIGDCRDFINRGTCQNRDICTSRHHLPAKNTSVICSKWKDYKCHDMECNYRHIDVQGELKRTPCPDDKKPEGCKKTMCRYLHTQSNNTQDQPHQSQNQPHQSQNQLPQSPNPEEEGWMFICQMRDKNFGQFSEVMVTTNDLMDMNLSFLDKIRPIPTSKSEICFKFLEEDCRKRYCQYRHCETPFMWEVRRDTLWVPLEKIHNKELERAFCSPETDKVKLTPYTAKTMPPAGHPLAVILDQNPWQASFEKNQITSSGKTLRIRRLSTPSSVACDSEAATIWKWYFQENDGKYMGMKTIDGTSKTASEMLETYLLRGDLEETVSISGRSYEIDLREMKQKNKATGIERNLIRRPQYQDTDDVVWSFLDEHNTWIPYGLANTKNNSSDINSPRIEAAYQQNSKGKMSFTVNNNFTYELNFSNMTQKNVQVGTTRRVKREVSGPRKYVKNQILPDVPNTWEDMGDELCKVIPLPAGSSEFTEIQRFFFITAGSNVTISKIRRVQNLTLWSNFVNQRKWMTKNYSMNPKLVNEQRLFHGTKVDVVEKICRENFNWRLAGSNVGHAYGRGSYFSNQASVSIGYCTPGTGNEKVMFVARVLIGTTIQGNSSMMLPPSNASGIPYDTTVDRVNSPSIFVKYYDNTVYPEYVITFF